MNRIFKGQTPVYILMLMLFSGSAAYSQNVPNVATQPAGSANIFPVPSNLPSEASGQNYTRSYSPMVPITNSQDVTENSPASDVKVATSYRDGFNRSIMTVIRNYTNNSRKDLVMPVDTRTQVDGYSYLPYATSGDMDMGSSPSAWYSQAETFNEQKAYYNNLYPGEGYTSFSRSQYYSDASERSVKGYAPGKSQVGQNRGTTTKSITNDANVVRMWEINSSGNPVSSGYYPADVLYGAVTTNADGAEVTVFKDKDGRVIYQKELQKLTPLVGSPQVMIPVYGTTYNVYDELGQLNCTVPPAATTLISAGTLTQAQLDNLCFQYNYNDKGQVTRKKLPGKAQELFVYDKLGRVVLYQDGNLAGLKKWSFTIYDKKGRTLCTGLYQSSTTQQILQGYFYDSNGFTPSDLFYYQKNYELFQQYPATITGAEIMSYNYYDNYNNVDPNGAIWATFNDNKLQPAELLNTPGAETPARGNTAENMPTGSKIKILAAPGIASSYSGEWRENANYYDDKGRVIYSVSRDLYQGALKHSHFVAGQYDFAGRSLINKHTTANAQSADGSHKELMRNYYDATTGALTQTQHKLDNGAWSVMALYTYDELGRVKRKVLGNYGEVRDFTYNIRGQLEGINPVYAMTGQKEGESRSFGESLKYDYGFTAPRYDGKISGMIWRGSSAASNNAYGYNYDKAGRLNSADYRKWEPASGSYFGPAWRKDLTDYSVSNLQYDLNGNILSMKQRGQGIVNGNVVPVDIDNLRYDYTQSSNSLYRTYDSVSVNYGTGDFQNTNGTNADYNNDANGNLAGDANKGLTITYNYLNKPDLIYIGSGGNKMSYGYDAAGSKVLYRSTQNGVTTITDYVGNFTYENGVLKYATTPEGRSVYDPVSHTFKEEFFVKDHLDNVRSVVDVFTWPMQQYLASYEVASANLEGLFFDNMDEVRDNKPGGSPGDNKAGNLNGEDPARRIGTAMLLKVMAGDKIELNVNNYYESHEMNNEQVPLEEMAGSIINTLTGGAGGFTSSESHNTKLVNDVFRTGNFEVYNDLLNAQTDPSKPKAYLNYILFDEGMKIVKEMSGAFQANGEGTWAQIGTTAPMAMPANGYLAVYLSNGSKLGCGPCGDVYFDQLAVRVSRGQLKEESHYYPFGLPIASMGSAAAGFTANKNKYQSNEYNKGIGLNWMDFHNRQYDPQLGRFLGIDPLAAITPTVSPYAAMDNDPGNQVDPMGLQPEPRHLEAMPRQTVSSMPWTASFENMTNKNYNGGAASSNAPGGMASWYSQVNASLNNDAAGAAVAQGYEGHMSGMTKEEAVAEGYIIDKDYGASFTAHKWDAGLNRVDENLIQGCGEMKWVPTVLQAGFLSNFNSFYANTSFIAQNALSFATTKTGRILTMGGAFVFKTSTYSVQKAMINPVIARITNPALARILGKEITAISAIKGTGNALGLFGLTMTAVDIGVNGLNTSNGLDAAFGVFSFVPGVGWVVGGVYFIGNAVSTGLTGKNIGQHVDELISPQNLDNTADDIIHYFSN